MSELKIMSFNMRNSDAQDGINCFENRKVKIKAMIDREKPDLIGMQEILPAMRKWIVETFSDYYTVGAGRDKGYRGESAFIAYKKDRFQLVSAQTVMLSTMPSTPGTFYDGSDQSGCCRAYTKVLLQPEDSDAPIYFYNVHTDHVGSLARILSSQQMLTDICSHNEIFFFTGDFNALPGSSEIKMMTACTARKVVDTTASLGGTFHAFGTRDKKPKIDYIFTTDKVKVIESRIIEDNPSDGIYYSDHNAIVTVVEL